MEHKWSTVQLKLYNSSLKELNLSFCSIDSDGAEFIAQALIKNSSLKKLEFVCK